MPFFFLQGIQSSSDESGRKLVTYRNDSKAPFDKI